MINKVQIALIKDLKDANRLIHPVTLALIPLQTVQAANITGICVLGIKVNTAHISASQMALPSPTSRAFSIDIKLENTISISRGYRIPHYPQTLQTGPSQNEKET